MTWLLIGAMGSVHAVPNHDAAYRKQMDEWRAHRLAELKAPNGWLSLTGMDALETGVNTIGSAKSCSIVIAKAPAHLGTIRVKDGRATLSLVPGVDVRIDGENKDVAELIDDSRGKPTSVSFGTSEFFVIQRAGKLRLFITDTQATALANFKGIDTFDVDPAWRIEAKWKAYASPHDIQFTTSQGQEKTFSAPGAAIFEHGGKTWQLEPVIVAPGDAHMLLVFADRTSGRQTYGAGRFLEIDAAKDGKVVLDFNKAFNPPCAFTSLANCPVPAPQNRLDLSVVAGERTYRGGHVD